MSWGGTTCLYGIYCCTAIPRQNHLKAWRHYDHCCSITKNTAKQRKPPPKGPDEQCTAGLVGSWEQRSGNACSMQLHDRVLMRVQKMMHCRSRDVQRSGNNQSLGMWTQSSGPTLILRAPLRVQNRQQREGESVNNQYKLKGMLCFLLSTWVRKAPIITRLFADAAVVQLHDLEHWLFVSTLINCDINLHNLSINRQKTNFTSSVECRVQSTQVCSATSCT